MIYIVVALKSEAQAFIERYKLGSSKTNDSLSILVSGLGPANMHRTTSSILKKMKLDDTLVNVGICGASTQYKVGDLLCIDIKTKRINQSDRILTCVNEAISETQVYDAVDMESEGFMQAVRTRKNVYMFKVVSDHFEPQNVNKDTTKKLISQQIDTIMERINE